MRRVRRQDSFAGVLTSDERLLDNVMPFRAAISSDRQRMEVASAAMSYGSYEEPNPDTVFRALQDWNSCACIQGRGRNGNGSMRCGGVHRSAQATLSNSDAVEFEEWCNRMASAVASGKLPSLTPMAVCELLKCSWVKAQAIVACLEREGVTVSHATVSAAAPTPDDNAGASLLVVAPPPEVPSPKIVPNDDGACVVPECAEAATLSRRYKYRKLLCALHNRACDRYVGRHWALVRGCKLETWVWLFVHYPSGPSPENCPFLPMPIASKPVRVFDACRVLYCHRSYHRAGLCQYHNNRHWAWRRQRGLRGRQSNWRELMEQWLRECHSAPAASEVVAPD